MICCNSHRTLTYCPALRFGCIWVPNTLQRTIPAASEPWLCQTHEDPNLVFSSRASGRFEEVVAIMDGKVLQGSLVTLLCR